MLKSEIVNDFLDQYEFYSKFYDNKKNKDNKISIQNRIRNYNLLKEEMENIIINNDYYEMYEKLKMMKLDKYRILIEEIMDMTHISDINKTKFKNIKTELYPYQINNVNWMINIENNIYNPFEYINYKLDNYNKSKLEESNKLIEKIKFKGGGLFDAVGMGKTLQIITLINENTSNYKSMIKNNKLYSKASLLIIPNHLCGQWAREFELHLENINNFKIINLLTKKHYYKYTFYDLMFADVIIVSSNFFINCNLNQHQSFDKLKIIKNILDKDVNIFNLYYHRIVIDEYHEIEDKQLFIKLKYLESDFKWILSGTPFNNIHIDEDNINHSSLSKIIDYLTDDIDNLIKLNIDNKYNYNYVKHKFSRNTHDKNIKILKLPNINENVIWLNFTDTEKAIYNSYLADNNNNPYDVFLRQICCHPRLADKIRDNIDVKIDNVADMDEIIKKMYFKDYNIAKENYDNCLNRINTIKDEITDKEDNNKTNQITYYNLKEELETKLLKITELKKILDGKEQQLTYYMNFLKIIKNNEQLQKEECVICMDNINVEDIGFTICGHIFCYSCIEYTMKNSHKCPTCNKILHKNELFYMNKNSDSNANVLGTKLAYIINYINQTPNKYRIIFSQWDYLLKQVGKVLEENNIKHLYCMGNVYQKDNVLKLFNTCNPDKSKEDYKIIMLSSENTVSGSNLTNAEEIIFLDPVYGDKQYRLNTENQAIGRVRRLGNKHKEINVIKLLIKNSIEETIYNQNI